MDKTTNATDIFLQLSHGLRNDFTVIRAVAGSIKKKSPPSEIIDEKVAMINQAVNQAMQRLEMAYALFK